MDKEYFREYFYEHCGDKYEAARYEAEPTTYSEEVSDDDWRAINELCNKEQSRA